MSAVPEQISFGDPQRGPHRPARPRYQSEVNANRYLTAIGVSIVTTALMAAWIGGYARLTVAGYQATALHSRLTVLQQSNRVLAERAALLSDPARINACAQQLGMQRAVPSQTIYVTAGEKSSSSPGSGDRTRSEDSQGRSLTPSPTRIAELPVAEVP